MHLTNSLHTHTQRETEVPGVKTVTQTCKQVSYSEREVCLSRDTNPRHLILTVVLTDALATNRIEKKNLDPQTVVKAQTARGQN